MSSPNPADQAPKDAPKDAPKGSPVQVGDVVRYSHHDHLLGREHSGVGVVATVADGAVGVRPLAGHTVQADPQKVTPASVDDLV